MQFDPKLLEDARRLEEHQEAMLGLELTLNRLEKNQDAMLGLGLILSALFIAGLVWLCG